ncbi:transcriptional regulator [Massilia eurypsychrophila]|uniref:Transcriptional regulator n=1 Tax=Massilia eurypsychrophila TaxID=1485217 RepID=A0A2G8T8L6_9BURK|nr:transcriptional regulator [Massilia eurypsychrophila]PIL42397.1 transcriptional regulator [Massilia eurypsychrophila]
MSKLPETGFLRLPQIIGNPKAVPPVPALIPIGRTAWWCGIKSGIYPAGFKLSPGVTVWKVEDIRKLIASV